MKGPSVSRSAIRLLTVAGVAAASIGLTALPALAHVTVSSPGATQGGFGVVTFRMPNETDTANATELKVQLPPEQPLASVSVKPQPGWSYTVTRAKLASPITDDDGNQVTDYPSVVDWKATAGGIKPGEYAEFQLSVGPLPKADSMVFKAVQSYSDGSVVSWIDLPAAGSSTEPEHPAPTLQLAAAGADTAATPTQNTAAPTVTASGDNASKSSVTGAYIVAGIGLLAGLAALALAATGRKRRATVEQTREPASTATGV
jgi:periplasmic copper chaperone A